MAGMLLIGTRGNATYSTIRLHATKRRRRRYLPLLSTGYIHRLFPSLVSVVRTSSGERSTFGAFVFFVSAICEDLGLPVTEFLPHVSRGRHSVDHQTGSTMSPSGPFPPEGLVPSRERMNAITCTRCSSGRIFPHGVIPFVGTPDVITLKRSESVPP